MFYFTLAQTSSIIISSGGKAKKGRPNKPKPGPVADPPQADYDEDCAEGDEDGTSEQLSGNADVDGLHIDQKSELERGARKVELDRDAKVIAYSDGLDPSAFDDAVKVLVDVLDKTCDDKPELGIETAVTWLSGHLRVLLGQAVA